MRREHFINLTLWVGALFGAVMLTGASGLVTDPAHHFLWLCCFGIGLCLMALLFVVALVAAVGDREEAKELERRHKMIPLVGMVVSGLALLVFAGWFFWPSAQVSSLGTAASEPLDYKIGIACAWSAPPSHYRDDKTLTLVDFQNVPDPALASDFTKQIAGPARFRRSADPFTPSPHYGNYWYRCDITNFGSVAIRNLRMEFPVEYRWPDKTENGTRSGDVIARGFALSADFDLAAGERDFFYFASASPAYVGVYLPQVATMQTLDSETVHTAKLVLPTDKYKQSFVLMVSDNPIGKLPPRTVGETEDQRWDQLTADEKIALRDRLRDNPADSLTVHCATPNCVDLGADLVGVFAQAGWQVKQHNGGGIGIDGLTGMRISSCKGVAANLKKIIEGTTQLKNIEAMDETPCTTTDIVIGLKPF